MSNKTNRKSTRTATRSNRVNAASASTASVSFVSPRGKVYQVENVSAFAKRFNLDRSALSKVARGERVQHKNWRVQS
jgi:hypothetical protein